MSIPAPGAGETLTVRGVSYQTYDGYSPDGGISRAEQNQGFEEFGLRIGGTDVSELSPDLPDTIDEGAVSDSYSGVMSGTLGSWSGVRINGGSLQFRHSSLFGMNDGSPSSLTVAAINVVVDLCSDSGVAPTPGQAGEPTPPAPAIVLPPATPAPPAPVAAAPAVAAPTPATAKPAKAAAPAATPRVEVVATTVAAPVIAPAAAAPPVEPAVTEAPTTIAAPTTVAETTTTIAATTTTAAPAVVVAAPTPPRSFVVVPGTSSSRGVVIGMLCLMAVVAILLGAIFVLLSDMSKRTTSLQRALLEGVLPELA